MKPSVRDVVAKAIYHSFKFKEPWEHPGNRALRLQMRRRATVAINAYNKAVRVKIRKLPA